MTYPTGGKFGEFGGRYIPETLVPAVDELESSYLQARDDREFQESFMDCLKGYAGRPTQLYYARNLTEKAGGARILLKREDLLHGGAHKINNTIGQALLAKRMGKERIIAETGAGQHGVATAMACAFLNMDCEIYMGERDMVRQRLNVFRMEMLGAKVHPVGSGSRTLKDAINEAIRDWITNVESTYYLLGSAVGPHPYPVMVRDFQSVIGSEMLRQVSALTGAAPTAAVACVGGGSNAIGTFYPLLQEKTELVGVEAAGSGLESGRHSATIARGSRGILHGMMSYLLQDGDGQVSETHSISAGLDYPGVGPEHSYLKETGRVRYTSADDEEAIRALIALSDAEGIIPALESAHAVAEATKMAAGMPESATVVVTLSGRGDKDVETVMNHLADKARSRPGRSGAEPDGRGPANV